MRITSVHSSMTAKNILNVVKENNKKLKKKKLRKVKKKKKRKKKSSYFLTAKTNVSVRDLGVNVQQSI